MNRITFSPARPHTKRRRPQTRRLELELLEARNLLSGTPSNVLVNDPAQDTSGNLFGQTGLDTQSETAIVLGAKSNVIVAYNDTGTLQYPTPFNPTAIGYSLSKDSGGSFKDQGQLPHSGPYWAAFDPVLARSIVTGTILLS